MSTWRPATAICPPGRHETGGHRAAVIGFTALAGTFMVLSGLWGVIVGTVALAHGHVFVAAPNYTFRYDVRSWGWAELVLGIVIFAAGACVFLGMTWARYLGAVLAVFSAIANFMFIPYQPVWSIVLIALDGFVIWALLSPRGVGHRLMEPVTGQLDDWGVSLAGLFTFPNSPKHIGLYHRHGFLPAPPDRADAVCRGRCAARSGGPEVVRGASRQQA